MKTLITILTATTLTLGLSTASQAKDGAIFKYNPKASVAQTYTHLTQQARKICKSELGPLTFHGGADCIEDYVTEVISKIGKIELTAYHNRMTGKPEQYIQLAQRKN